MTVPRDQHLGEFRRRVAAASELLEHLKNQGELPLSKVAELAKAHNVEEASLLREAELSPDCDVDLAAGVLRCPK